MLSPKHLRKMFVQLGMAVKRPTQVARVAASEVRMRLGLPTLRSVEFQVTHGCNLDCPFCYAADIMKAPNRKGNMSLEKVRSVFDECYDLGMIHVNITGGEPLLRKDIYEIVDSVPKSVVVSLVTNSSLLNKDVVDSLRAAGLSTLQMSYGSNYTDFNRDIARYCIQSGISVTLSIVNVIEEREFNEKAMEMAIEDGFNVLYNYPMRFNNSGLDREFYWAHRDKPMVREDNMFWSGRNVCPAGLTKIYITNDGEVSACDRVHDFVGDLYQSSVRELWETMREQLKGRPSYCLLETDPEEWRNNNQMTGKDFPLENIGRNNDPFNVLAAPADEPAAAE
jgi:MoaA/NifB/PqqE/SkfB family radical SAM enzyme